MFELYVNGLWQAAFMSQSECEDYIYLHELSDTKIVEVKTSTEYQRSLVKAAAKILNLEIHFDIMSFEACDNFLQLYYNDMKKAFEQAMDRYIESYNTK